MKKSKLFTYKIISMTFYKPLTFAIHWIDVLCCIDQWVELILERKKNAVSSHLHQLLGQCKDQLPAEYYVVFLWKDGSDVMTDIWAHNHVEKWWSWPLIDVKIFRNAEPETSIGIGSGNTIRVLWIIEEHRVNANILNNEFLLNQITFPEWLVRSDDFYMLSK